MRSIKQSFCCIFALGAIFSLAQLVVGCSKIYDGKKLFFTVGCSQCHTFKGRGGRMAPDLSAVTNIRSVNWIDSYLQNPVKMNPHSRMPSFAHLSRAKRNAIINFLKQ